MMYMYTELDESWTLGSIFADATDFPFGTCMVVITTSVVTNTFEVVFK